MMNCGFLKTRNCVFKKMNFSAFCGALHGARIQAQLLDPEIDEPLLEGWLIALLSAVVLFAAVLFVACGGESKS